MTKRIDNNGVIVHGNPNLTGVAIGRGASIHVTAPAFLAGTQASERTAGGWDIGIVTATSKETYAVENVFELKSERVAEQYFSVGEMAMADRVARIVVTQSLDPGQRPIMNAVKSLCWQYAPKIVALVGIAGGIHQDVRVRDVVVATRVVYYDLRKETPGGTMHRGEERSAPAEIGYAVNRFFAEYGYPAEFPRSRSGNDIRLFRVLAGTIGSGEAVIADGGAEIRRYLESYNDKILAVDMESGGLAQYCHENASGPRDPRGWVVVRGISDDAKNKNDAYQNLAARHAAIIMRELIAYLVVGSPSDTARR